MLVESPPYDLVALFADNARSLSPEAPMQPPASDYSHGSPQTLDSHTNGPGPHACPIAALARELGVVVPLETATQRRRIDELLEASGLALGDALAWMMRDELKAAPVARPARCGA